MIKIKLDQYPHNIFLRDNKTDIQVYKELIERRNFYEMSKYGIKFKNGQNCLDLGANIGMQTIYLLNKGCNVISFEPDKGNFKILKKNTKHYRKVDIINSAFSHYDENEIVFYENRNNKNAEKRNDYRYTTEPLKTYVEAFRSDNFYAGDLKQSFDFVKMDIEGGEFGLIDNELIPDCKLLVMEYHNTKDRSGENYLKRLDILRKQFKEVHVQEHMLKKANTKQGFDKTIKL